MVTLPTSPEPAAPSTAARLASAKQRLNEFDQSDPPAADPGNPRGNAGTPPRDDDASLVSALTDGVSRHFSNHARSYLIGLGTGAGLLALRSSLVRKTLLAAGLQFGTAKVRSWFVSGADAEDETPLKAAKKKPTRKKPKRSRKSEGTFASKDGSDS